MLQRFFHLFITLLGVSSCITAQNDYRIELVTGTAIQQCIPFLANMRLCHFREYPYLYEGTLKDECAYLEWFSTLKHSTLVIIFFDNQPIGVISGTGLADFDAHFAGTTELFKKTGLDSADFYYLAEAIIDKEHRGKSLATQAYMIFEKHVCSLGYANICFATETHESHPSKPSDYKDLDSLCKHFGYTKSNMHIFFTWNTLQSDGYSKEQEHILTYWVKELK